MIGTTSTKVSEICLLQLDIVCNFISLLADAGEFDSVYQCCKWFKRLLHHFCNLIQIGLRNIKE